MKDINLLRLIDNHLVSSDKKKLDTRERKSHHPSGVNKCLRQMYYDWTSQKVSDYRNAVDIWRMTLGTWIHKMCASILKDMGYEVVDEFEIHYDDDRLAYPIHGYIDNVIIIDEKFYGIEFKTVFGYGAKIIQQSGKPREDDIMQVLTYLATQHGLDGFFLDYLARDSFYRTEFQITRSEEEKEKFINKVVEKFERLELAVMTKQIPDRDFHAVVKDGEIKNDIQHKGIKYKSDWQCCYCVYRSHCYSKEIASLDICIPEKLQEATNE